MEQVHRGKKRRAVFRGAYPGCQSSASIPPFPTDKTPVPHSEAVGR